MTAPTTRRGWRANSKKFRPGSLMLAVCAVVALPIQTASGAVTDLSSEPLATRPTVQAKPNLMFILDNSGSMAWSYMPDQLGVSNDKDDEPYYNWYGYYSTQCNGVAFDPNGSYPVPVGNVPVLLDVDVKAAPDNGYLPDSGTKRDLTSDYYYVYKGSLTPMDWNNSDFVTECKAKIVSGNSDTTKPGTSAGNGTNFTKALVSSLSAAKQQAYANWYSYYRKRYLLMRTAMGRAIATLDASYRVGFTTINVSGNTNTSITDDGSNLNFRNVKDFDATQKANFYTSLYGTTPDGSTPLRAALSRVGSYFAKQVSGQTYDPVQYSCQRNYALLSTDGYWNSGAGYKLNGTSVGNQDQFEARPMRDNSVLTSTTSTVYTSPASSPATQTLVGTRTKTLLWTRVSTTVSTSKRTSNPGKNQYTITKVTQTYSQTQTETYTTPQSGTASFVRKSVSVDDGTPTVTDDPVTYSSMRDSGSTTVTLTDTGAPVASTAWSTPQTDTSTYQSTQGDGTTKVSTTSGSWTSWNPANPSYTATNQNPGNLADFVPGTPSTVVTGTGGSSNTLSDVAEYYYATDLRNNSLNNCSSTPGPGENTQDVCANIVRTTDADPANWQHMNTFTIGLGVSGTLPYDRNYLTQTSGTYAKLKTGELRWPTPPTNGGNSTTVDDLWHAAVNGRGQYYSAQNASALSEAINGVLTTVQATVGSASAASTSALELVAGDNNQVYQASYMTQAWTGDLQAFSLNGDTGAIATTPTWSAQAKLDAKAASARNIYFRGSNGSLQAFTYDNLSSDQQGYFSNFCNQALVSTQCANLTDTDKAVANSGTELVNYLRGDRTRESASTNASSQAIATLYRKRDHVLGDIINGAPVHVGKPPFAYADNGYATFAANNAIRKPVVYVGANDGMLHAISAATADGGTELWAYVPGQVMSGMYKMADSSYAIRHQYYVDGAPVMGDIKVGSTWKTILVGGFNAGGRGYYALDITDPANPRSLWEFNDTNMGNSFGNPVITKRKDGTWVVAFTSGYNNTGGDGQGHLYVVNANTGALLLDIATGVGSSTDPSGLSKINAWIDSPIDNTSKRFYGGDLQGNLWRFDMDNLVAPNQGAMKLANLAAGGVAQPITTKPETIEVSGYPAVVVATGKYLGVTDITKNTKQSIYAIKDTMTDTGWGDVHADTTNFVVQSFTLSTAGDSASVTNKKVDWSTKGGWYVDLPHDYERVATNMALQFNTLAIASAIPNGDACASGGSSWMYYLDVTSGGVVQSNPSGVLWNANTLIVGMSWVKDTNGNVRLIVQNSDGKKQEVIPPTVPPSGSGSAHRTSWRELMD